MLIFLGGFGPFPFFKLSRKMHLQTTSDPKSHSFYHLGGNLKDSKKWLSENTKIPRPSKLVRKYRHLFNILFDLSGFTYVLRCFVIFRFQNLSRFHHRQIFENARRSQLFRAHHILKKTKTKHEFHILLCPIGSTISETLDFWNDEIWDINVF